ncbi:hypothetical protein IMZ29_17505 [Achromobacter sp. GG226]|uniref:hypothetical protein n=1 Tax=Verticiella alkaliphila TaxID=2779529 RepID=UPI001C0DCDA3|nr:hypothetical protein [Verticiella sp. GG226]MBU4612272.1 hypothetical protein [Verticiella sp. GG226]
MKFSNSDSSLLRRFKRKLHWQAHLLLPNFIPALCEHDAVDFDEIDRKHNEFSRVPEGECLRAAVIWGMELYGPREVDNLYERLDRLNWTAGFGRPAEEGAHHWIRQQRNYGAAGAWYNVGHVSDEGRAKRFIGVGNHAVIPNGVDYLLVRIFQLTPSLTCLLIGFVLKEELARVYECELLRDRTSQRERRRGATSVFILNPENLKSRALRKARGDLRFVAYNWFREHLPGFFSKLPSDRLPTAELVSTQFTNLLDAENIPRDWRRLFGYPSKFDVWTHQAHPGLHFAAESAPWIEDSNHLLVNLCTSQVPDEILRIWGERSARAYANFGHEALDGILVNHAAIAFLKEVSKDLKISRSEFAMHGAGRRNPSSALDKIQAFLIDH